MVDDDPQDIYLTKRAFCSQMPELRFAGVNSCVELFDYLYSRGAYSENTGFDLPDMILLDINLPKENGFEVLSKLRTDSTHRHIPVSMLTTSAAPYDVQHAYESGVNCYISKTVSFADMQKTAERFCSFWFDLARLPTSNT